MRARAPSKRVASAIAWATLVVACGGSAAMRAADRGDLGGLRSDLGARERAGAVSNREAADLAAIIAKREVALARPADAVERVRDVRPCAAELDGALEDRMRIRDAAGAEAALALLADGRLDVDDVRSFAASLDDGWRAVGVRGLGR